jgi:GH15 family glucan-1,4-alpha-glucosidase
MTPFPSPAAGADLLRHDPVARHSRAVLLAGQAPSGALVASPAFPVYAYSWLRDGSFCAQALDLLGETAAADAFHLWAARTVLAHEPLARESMAAVRAGVDKPPYLPTRFTLDGRIEDDVDSWPNFQLDGYGAWLRAVADRTHGEPPREIAAAVRLVADYLVATWAVDCNDCWEEPGDGQHTSTLLAVASGLSGAADLLRDRALHESADAVAARLLERHVRDGRLTKSVTSHGVDGSLLWLGTSFDLSGVDMEPLRAGTVAAVRADLLVPGGGVRRYLGDSYYGGGEWLLLTSWLGWHAARDGDQALSDHCASWVRGNAGPGGELAEQTTDHPQVPDMVEHWVGEWGPVADPLLWSHAMDLVHAACVVEAGWGVRV